MISDNNKISEIFSIFHDGRFTKHVKHSTYSFLYVDCMYLAEQFNKDFDHFMLKVYELSNVELNVWTRDADDKPYTIDEVDTVFQTPLDIYDSEVLNGKLTIKVGQNDISTLDYVGGDLSFYCSGIEIFDPRNIEIHFSDLVEVCEKYWREFSER